MGQPDNLGSIYSGPVREGCVRYIFPRSCTEDASCISLLNPYICEINLSTSSLQIKDPKEDLCFPKWSYFGGSCYFYMEQIKLNFTSAIRECQSRSATLVIPNTHEEFEFIKSMLLPDMVGPNLLKFSWVCGLI